MSLPPFQAVLDAHGEAVHRLLVATVGREEADDCYQEAWIAALRHYPRLRSDANLRAWILTVAHRKALDHFRARRRGAAPVPDPGAAAARDADQAGELGTDDGLWGAVRGLPDKQRAAIGLRFVADASYDQIAEVMGTSPEAARRSVHEGLKRLRKEYA